MTERLNKQEGQSNIEVVKTPEITVKKEQGLILCSLLLKAEGSGGDTDNTLSKETSEYFRENPLDQSIIDTLKELREDGVDEESFYNIALAHGNPERLAAVLEMAKKYKPRLKDPQESAQKFFGVLQLFDESFSGLPLAQKLDGEAERDKRERLKTENTEDTRKRIENLISFFRPSPETTPVRKITVTTTNPLVRKNSGRAFHFGEELVVMSHIENKHNFEHEFLHSVINPIVEKLSQLLTDEQKERIAQLSSSSLKQDYGEGHFSLLCEELIRTYNDVFQHGEKPETAEDFKRKVDKLDEDGFKRELTKNKNLSAQCEELGVKNAKDFKDKSKEYFERYRKSQLREIIFGLYQEYAGLPDKDETNFEQFLMERFASRI